jgi:hypothetical protein
MKVVPAAVRRVPNPEVPGRGVIIGLTGFGAGGQTVAVVNETHDRADGRKLFDSHRELLDGMREKSGRAVDQHAGRIHPASDQGMKRLKRPQP